LPILNLAGSRANHHLNDGRTGRFLARDFGNQAALQE
jgi:hypothetical protein